MKKTVAICSVLDDIHLKMKLLCIGRNVSMAELLKEMVEKEWESDKTIVDKLQKRKLGRIIRKFGLQ